MSNASGPNEHHDSTSTADQGVGATSNEEHTKHPHPPVPNLDDWQQRNEAITKMWSFYMSAAEKVDKEMVENWKGDTEGILVFTGLFATTVSAFVIESYKGLQPDSGAQTVALLTQLLAGYNGDESSQVDQPFEVPSSSVRLNILWILNLCISISCALIAVMVQQWARRYTRLCQRTQKEPGLQARIHIHLYAGIKKYHMDDMDDLIPSLLHLAVFLFFAGLAQFLFPINSTVAYVVLAFLLLFLALYATFTVHPMFYHSSPFYTPLSAGIWRALPLVRWPWHFVMSFSRMATSMYHYFASTSQWRSGFTWKNYLPSPPLLNKNLTRTFSQKVRCSAQGEPELNGLVWMVRNANIPSPANACQYVEGMTILLLSIENQRDARGRSVSGPMGRRLSNIMLNCVWFLRDRINMADSVGRRSAVLYMFLLWTVAQRLETTLISLPGLSDWNVVQWLKKYPHLPVVITARIAQAEAAYHMVVRCSRFDKVDQLDQFVQPPSPLSGYLHQDTVTDDTLLLLVLGLVDDILPHLKSRSGSFHRGTVLRLLSWGSVSILKSYLSSVEDPSWGPPSEGVVVAFAAMCEQVEGLASNIPGEGNAYLCRQLHEDLLEVLQLAQQRTTTIRQPARLSLQVESHTPTQCQSQGHCGDATLEMRV